MGLLPESELNIQVDIYDISHDLAQVKVASAPYIDYLQITRIDGE